MLAAQALTITPSSTPQWTGTNNSNLSASAIDAYLLTLGRDVNGTLSEVYKRNVGQSDDGNLRVLLHHDFQQFLVRS